jgi:PAS domain S-box-containing protein
MRLNLDTNEYSNGFLESLKEVFVLYDPVQDHVQFISPSIETVLGYTQDDFMSGKIRFKSLIDKSDLLFFNEVFSRFFYGDSINRFRLELLHASQYKLTTSWTAGYKAPYWYCLIQDISFITNVENDLLRERARLELIIDKVTDIVFQTDAKGLVLYANWRAEQILGVPVSEILWRPLLSYLNPGLGHEKAVQNLKEYFSFSTTQNPPLSDLNDVDFVHIKPNGSRVYLVISITSVLSKEGKVVGRIGTIRDETVLEKKKQELFEASRFSSLGQMAAGVAHEINNPLAVVSLTLENLRDEWSEQGKVLPNEPMQENFERIETCIARIHQIVKSLQLVSGVVPHEKMTEVKLSNIVQYSLDLCREMFEGEGIQVHTSDFQDFQVKGKRGVLSQAVFNIMQNAFEATKRNHSLVRWVRVTSKLFDGKVALTIENSGPLIPEAERVRVFHPFYTTKDVGKGSGLGLSVAKGIIESHGGQLYLLPDTANTTFQFEFA